MTRWSELPLWAWAQGLRDGVNFRAGDSAAPAGHPDRETTLPTVSMNIDSAQVITSSVEYPEPTGLHKPVLDIDFPAQLIPSTTPGHFHLYLDKEITWEKYRALLRALADAGVIEQGYCDASIARGYSAVRLPWVPKEEYPADEPEAATGAPTTVEQAIADGSLTELLGDEPDASPELGNTAAAYAELRANDPVLRHLGEALTMAEDDLIRAVPGLHPNARSAQLNTAPNPAPVISSVPRSAWGAADSDPLGDIIAARDLIANAPAYAPNPVLIAPPRVTFDGRAFTVSNPSSPYATLTISDHVAARLDADQMRHLRDLGVRDWDALRRRARGAFINSQVPDVDHERRLEADLLQGRF